MKYPWYVAHSETKYVVAGFKDYSDAEVFVKCFSHGMYKIYTGSSLGIE